MNKTILGIFALLFMVTSVNAIQNCDVDGNGVEDLTDAIYLAQLQGMDLNGDGVINFDDAIFMSETINADKCHDVFWDILFQVETPVEEENRGCSGDHSYHRDLSHNDYIRYDDTMGYNHRRFLLDNKEYYMDMQWNKYWLFGWKANDNVVLTIKNNEYETIKKVNMNEDGTFTLGGETIRYETNERSVPIKRVKMWIEE
jgi:hypothetical protein